MSIYKFYNEVGRLVHFGLDKPTGGYFFNEFLNDSEIKSENDELASTGQSLTFTELEKELGERFSYVIYPDVLYNLVNDFVHVQNPTHLQMNVGKIFGHDLALKNGLQTVMMRSALEKENTYIPYGIGCGLARGDWNIVQFIIEDVFKYSDCHVFVLKLNKGE
jgi:hypothetical protein